MLGLSTPGIKMSTSSKRGHSTVVLVTTDNVTSLVRCLDIQIQCHKFVFCCYCRTNNHYNKPAFPLINPLGCRGSYSATSKDMKSVHSPLMGGLFRDVRPRGMASAQGQSLAASTSSKWPRRRVERGPGRGPKRSNCQTKPSKRCQQAVGKPCIFKRLTLL